MTRAALDPRENCPADLCCYGDCWCAPSGAASLTVLSLRMLGVVAIGLALAGVVLPVLPTTPFLLVAAWAFARTSPRLDAWLRAHPRLGPPLAAWEQRRAIPRKAKAFAAASLPAGWLLLWLGDTPVIITALAGAVMAVAGGWVLTRPS